MSNVSYTFHISNGKFSINNSKNLKKAFEHNLRSYKSDKYNKEVNEILIGANNAKEAYEDFKKILSQETDLAVEKYNSTKTKTRDKIENYFEKVSEDKKTELATEIIIQIGDIDFWQDKDLSERKKMNSIFKEQLKKLNELCPELKVVSAVIHYDEASPHLQIIGIPIKDFEKGLSKRISKTKVFTIESLEKLQTEMRSPILSQMRDKYGNNIKLKEKDKGRNKDLFVKDYVEMKNNMKKEINEELEKEFLPKLKELKTEVKKQKEYLENNQIAKMNLTSLENLKKKKKKEKIKTNFFQVEEKEIYEAVEVEKTLQNLIKENFDIKVYQNKINELKIEKKAIYEDNLKKQLEINKLKEEKDKISKELKNLNEIMKEIEKRMPEKIKQLIDNIKEIFKTFSGVWSKNLRDKELEKLDSRLGIKNNEKDKTLER